MKSTKLIDLFQKARKDTDLAVIEGVQALKHAIRFKAKINYIICSNKSELELLLHELADDTAKTILDLADEVDEAVFSKLSPQPPRTKVIALAKRRSYQLEDVASDKPILLLEDPRDLENIGAVVRVAAAADSGAVCITGPADIWHPAVIRGGAGLQFAVPVIKTTFDEIKALKRPLISLDPAGELMASTIPKNAVLIFGTERHGISKTTLEASDKIIRLPMKQGVSSLNLATSVAATLYKM